MENDWIIKGLRNILDNPSDNLSYTSRDVLKTIINYNEASNELKLETIENLKRKLNDLFIKNEFFKPQELIDDIIEIINNNEEKTENILYPILNQFNEINSDIPVWSIKAVPDDKRKTFYQLIRKDSKNVYFAGYDFEFISEYVNYLNSLNNPRRVNIENRVNKEIELWVCDGLHEKNEDCNYVKIL